MLVMLNKWARYNNRTGRDYAYWARPGLPEINGDLPVLLLSENDLSHNHQGGFRSLSTYEGGHILQYGGPARDTIGHTPSYTNPQLDGALTRATAGNSLFIYGDVVVGPTVAVSADKVSIYENASIKSPGTLASFDETYVGITFDNSCRHAYSTPGMNYGIVGMGGFLLPRDWHMFSTPLSNAPQGFDYRGQNEPQDDHDAFNSLANDNQGFYNNPWVNMNTEFSWLSTPGSDECASGAANRYWMKAFDATNQKTDGYFPSRRGSLFNGHVNDLFIVGSDECPSTNGNRYPYGMDFYTWTEPDYHWINFKRNGPNHWHSDENDQGVHMHLDYYGSDVNVNEETLITGRGYMAAISIPTFMQSHGTMNTGPQTIPLTRSGTHCSGWNMVGNPYHGFLDFNEFASQDDGKPNKGVIDAFYVVYDADAYSSESKTGFIYYPEGGSVGGEYAGPYIHPHQGFFVLAKGAGTLTFNEGMLKPRSTVKADSLFREQQPRYPLINLYLSSDNGCRDVTVIEFNRSEWGGATKLRELRQGNGSFYGYHDEQRYAALFTKIGTPRVPLWFEAHEDDIFTIKWKTANADFQSLYLIDNLLGIQYDMLRNDTYVFEGHKDDYYSRFYIVFDVTGIEENDGNDGFVFFEGSQWMVTGDGDLDFIDMNGRVLWTGRVSGQQRVSLPNVAAGIYMFRLVESNNVKIQKVIVKKRQ